MPYDDRSNRICNEYQQILGELEACINDLGSSNIIYVGDYNADPNRGRLWGCVWEFVTNGNLTVADLTLPINSFTYLSLAHNTTSWLDHAVVSKDITVSNCDILYNFSIYDHFRFISNFRCSVCLIIYRVLTKRH